MREMIFGMLTDPGAEEYREPFGHRSSELLRVCQPGFWEAPAGRFGERTIESTAGRRAR